MTDLNKPGCSDSPPPRQGRIATPPRTFPSHLDDSSPLLFDSRQQVPFSPTSPGKRSPGRPKTMKEYEEDLVSLKRENFNLKVRIYFMEQSRFDPNLPKDIDELRNSFTDLKVEYELQKKDLASKEDLLLNTYRALDAQKQQLEAMKTEHEAEKQELLSKIDSIEKELKEYQMKFMETSIQLDDTNAMYAITFGLNNKTDSTKPDCYSDQKVKELENDLAKEKERVLMLEDMIAGMNAKSAKDQECLQHLNQQVESIEEKLTKSLNERDLYEGSVKEAAYQTIKLEKSLQRKTQVLKQKESELESVKSIITDLEKELISYKCKLQEKQDTSVQADTAQMELQKHTKNLLVENSKLKQEIKLLHQQLESRTPLRPLRERSSGRRSSDQEREQVRQLREAKAKVEELQKEIDNNRTRYNRSNVEGLIQTLYKENKVLKKELDELKAHKLTDLSDSSKKEFLQNIDELNKDMSSEKDDLILELKCNIEELTKIINDKEIKLQEYKLKLESLSDKVDSEPAKTSLEALNLDSEVNQEKEKILVKELDDKKKEVESLKKELKKRTYNLQGLVNTELWDKNREIEKLNKVCERQHLELLSLQKQLRELQSFVPPLTLQGGLFEDKENLQPLTDPMLQLQHLNEEKRLLLRKVEELQSRLLNTPERDKESLLVQNLRAERDQAEKLRKEAVNACMLLTTRLQELADFLDSLLPSLCGKKRKFVQQAVERSRELSKSLSLAADESSAVLQCSAWSDLQPSLFVPLLPDISTVDFWSGDECQEEPFSGNEEMARLKSQVETLTEEVKQKDGEIAKFQNEKTFSDSFVLKSVFGFDEQELIQNVENRLLDESILCGNLVDITEDSCSEPNVPDATKLLPEVKSINIGKITLTSRKKDPNVSLHTPEITADTSKPKEKEGCLSEYETWSEPDRDVSYARMGLKEEPTNGNKSLQYNCGDTSETADSSPKSPSSRKANEIQRCQRKIRSLEQVNEALRSELLILHQLAPPATSRQDKATSIELSRQNLLCVPSHLLEEIRNQREKLEASLFHNDYIRRQLESTVSSLRRSQVEENEKTSLVKLEAVTDQLERAENELAALKLEKEEWNKKIAMLQAALQDNSNELTEKQCALLELENKTRQQLKDAEEKFNNKCSQAEHKYTQLEQKWSELQQEKMQLMEKLTESNAQIDKLTTEIENYQQESKKHKQVQEDLNLQLQQMFRQRDDLEKAVAEQEQLLADAERERQELATQLIARDHQVSDLQKQLGQVEQASSKLEAVLRSQLDTATHQCAQFEVKIRDLDSCSKKREEVVVELQRRLDCARFAHSEAVLQYTRVANDNIKLQGELRRRQHEPNQIDQVERIKCELERRVAELEVVNTELETRLTSLNVVKPPYSDCETDTGSSVVGSPRRNCPPPLLLPATPPHPYTTQRSNDFTSDYLSDQDAALSSPQAQTRNLWFPTSPHSQLSASPDLGIESDHGRFSSLETQAPKSTAISIRGTPVKDLMKLEEENTQLRRNLQKTRHALEETLSQLTAANQHKRQYEAQLSAANQHKTKVERAICRQLVKTHSILKKARVNLEDGKSEPQ